MESSGAAQVGTRFEARAMRGLTSFVGRQIELQALKGSLYDIIKEKPQYVAIVAPAGMGKTQLVEEFLRGSANSDCLTLRGYCESYLSAEPLQPFLQIFRSLLGLDYGCQLRASLRRFRNNSQRLIPVSSSTGPSSCALFRL